MVDPPIARLKLPWSSLLWLLPVLLLLGLAMLGAAPQRENRSADSSAATASPVKAQPVLDIDHSSVDWSRYPVEPAKPEQSVAAYDRE